VPFDKTNAGLGKAQTPNPQPETLNPQTLNPETQNTLSFRFKFDNVKAVHKILKKHDKISSLIHFSSTPYLHAAEKTFLFAEHKLAKMITMVERSFQKNVLQGKAGKKSLLNEADTTVISQVSSSANPFLALALSHEQGTLDPGPGRDLDRVSPFRKLQTLNPQP
jgi:hypothetical protein